MLNGLGSGDAQARYRRQHLAVAKAAQAAKALHDAYTAAEAKFVAASKVEAQSMLNLAAAIAGKDQNKINLAVQSSLIAENNAMNAGVAASIAASADPVFQQQRTAGVIKASLLPANGYWNEPTNIYGLSQAAYNALRAGKVIYNYFPGNSHQLAQAMTHYCNNFYRANPKATLAQVNAYGAQLQQAAQSSDSFGSFLMGALPYIAIVAVIAMAVVFTAGALAPAASSALTTGSGAALTTGGTLTNAQIVAAGAAEGDAGGGAIAAASTGTAATLGTGAASGLSTGASGLLTSVETAGGAVATSSIESKIVGGIKNLFNPKPAAPAPGAPVAAPKQSSFLTPAIMVAGIGLVFELLKN